MKAITQRALELIMLIALAGCAITPYEQLNLDTTTEFRQPSIGKAGVYVYQWKTGIIGAAMDVNFEIRGLRKIALNTGEYGYFEVAPGQYDYKVMGGFSPIFVPVKFEAGKNYFFRAALSGASDTSFLVRDQPEIDDTKRNILDGRYEAHDAD